MREMKYECFTCKTFDKRNRQSYKCCIKGNCPGIDWSDKEKVEILTLSEEIIGILEK